MGGRGSGRPKGSGGAPPRPRRKKESETITIPQAMEMLREELEASREKGSSPSAIRAITEMAKLSGLLEKSASKNEVIINMIPFRDGK